MFSCTLAGIVKQNPHSRALRDSINQSFQSQTWAKKCAMFTFLVFISTIQGCSSIRQGVARREGSFSRLDEGVRLAWILYCGKPWEVRRGHSLRALDKILETLTPFDAVFFFILQLRNRLPHDIGQEIYQTCSWLHFRPVRWEWEAVLRDFEKSDA